MSEFKVDTSLKENYEQYYKGDNSLWRRIGAIEKADNIKSLCGELGIESMIEIGAGDGSILERLSEDTFCDAFYALDISSTGVEAIRKKNIRNLEECHQFDGYTVPYGDKRFDLAVLSHVIEHVEYPRQLIYEAKRIAKYVYVEVPLEDTLRLGKNFVLDEVGHINFYSPTTIRRLLQTCNLEVIGEKITNRSLEGYVYQNSKSGKVNFYVKDFLLKIAPRIATRVFTYHSSIVCST